MICCEKAEYRNSQYSVIQIKKKKKRPKICVYKVPECLLLSHCLSTPIIC